MDRREEEEAPLITMRHLRALAGKRGYRVRMDDTHLSLMNKSDEQITHSFDLHDPFRIDPLYTQQFPFIRISLWIHGYDLSYEEPTAVRRERARHHCAWNLRQPYAKQYAYEGLFLLLSDIAMWIQYLETHHCPFLELLPMEEKISMSHSEHCFA